MPGKEENVKVSIEAARRGDVDGLCNIFQRIDIFPFTLPVVKTVFTDLLRFVGEIRDKKKKVKLLELFIPMFNVGDLSETVEQMERMLRSVETLAGSRTIVKRLEFVVGRLSENTLEPLLETFPIGTRHSFQYKKKRGGCVSGGGGSSGGRSGVDDTGEGKDKIEVKGKAQNVDQERTKDEDRLKKAVKGDVTIDDFRKISEEITIKDPIKIQDNEGVGRVTGPEEEEESEPEPEPKEEEESEEQDRPAPDEPEEEEEYEEEEESEEGFPLTFSAHWPPGVKPEEWNILLVYIYNTILGLRSANFDLTQRVKEPKKLEVATVEPTKRLKFGDQILIVPQLSDFLFEPKFQVVKWKKDWAHAEFRMRTVPTMNSMVKGKRKGYIDFFVGPLLIGRIEFDVLVGHQTLDVTGNELKERINTIFRKVFISYSHDDEEIAERLESYTRGAGDQPFRDVNFLLGGEEWEPAIQKRINIADIFQLCWSKAASASSNVEDEWRYALRLKGKSFIKPVYWKGKRRPIPPPPLELEGITFTKILV